MGCTNCSTGNPINLSLGNKYAIEPDYRGSGPFPLTFTRYYNSHPSDSLVNGLVFSTRLGRGSNWRHSYDRSIDLTVSTVFTTAYVYRPDGKIYSFNLVNGNFVGDADVNDRLQQLFDSSNQPAGWRYTTSPNDEVELYDVNGVLLSITNRAGLTQTLSYDQFGRLQSVADPLGRALTFTYDTYGRVATVTDPAGQVIQYGYTNPDTVSSNLTSVTYPGGAVRNYLYNEAGLSTYGFVHVLTGIQDENGARYGTYSYDGIGRAVAEFNGANANSFSLSFGANSTTVTDPLGVTRTFSFQNVQGVARSSGTSQSCSWCGGANYSAGTQDANGNVSSRTDFNGNRTHFTYDLIRNLETQRIEGFTSPGGTTSATRTISTQWHPTFRLPIAIAEPKRITTIAYDAQGNVTSKSIQATADANGSQSFNATPTGPARTWTYANTYSSTIPGLLVQQVVDGPRTDVADVTTYVYDAQGNLSTVTNALGQTTAITSYDVYGKPLTLVDPNGLTTTLTYDVRQRLTARTMGTETTSYSYDGVGQLTRVTLPDGSFVAYTYDTAHRLIAIADNLGNHIAYTLDGLGNRLREDTFDPANQLALTRARVYDGLSRLVQDIGGTNPATQVTRYGYDAQGNLTSITDPLNHVTTQGFDALNRLASMLDPRSGRTQYGYDGLDQLTQVTDPRGLTTQYGMSGLGTLDSQVSPDTGSSANTYDAAGNLLTSTDARGDRLRGRDCAHERTARCADRPRRASVANGAGLGASRARPRGTAAHPPIRGRWWRSSSSLPGRAV